MSKKRGYKSVWILKLDKKKMSKNENLKKVLKKRVFFGHCEHNALNC